MGIAPGVISTKMLNQLHIRESARSGIMLLTGLILRGINQLSHPFPDKLQN
jgi:hypothetical protein